MFRRSGIGRVFGVLLLAVYLTAFLSASLHVHPAPRAEGGSCYECDRGVHHGGHLSKASSILDECLLCHFAAASYVAASFALPVFSLRIVSAVKPRTDVGRGSCSVRIRSVRAPPVCL